MCLIEYGRKKPKVFGWNDLVKSRIKINVAVWKERLEARDKVAENKR